MIKKHIALLIFLWNASFFAQNISVNQTLTPTQLVQNVLLNSSCTSVSNVTVSGGNFGGSDVSFGYFNKNGSAFPFQEGVLLSTGKINSAIGPNSNFSDDGGGIGWAGDADLNAALGLSNTFNATFLEFDFVPAFNSIVFEYIFSSEQYLSNPGANQCNFTDGFAFLLRPSSSTVYQNLALIPGTNTPVRVNTVRGPGTICPAANETFFDAFNQGNYPTAFDGQTKVLTAQSAVIPGQSYHIKLVIADEGNHRFDSGIFLKGGSFNSEIDLGVDRLYSTNNPRCLSENIVLNATTIGATAYKWFKNGLLLPTETSANYTITDSGTYTVEVTVGTCTVPGKIIVEDEIILNINKNYYIICEPNSDGFFDFNITTIKANLYSNLPSNFTVNLFTNNGISINPTNNLFTNTVINDQTIYAIVPQLGNCFTPTPVFLSVVNFNNIFPTENVAICNNNPTTLTAPPTFINYQWSTNPVQNIPTIDVSIPGLYSVTFTTGSGCVGAKVFNVTNATIATITNVEVNDFNENLSATISVSGNGNYVYSINNVNYQSSNIISLPEAAEYTVYVKDLNGCGIAENQFFALSYPKFFTPNNDGYNDTWQIKNLDKKGFENSSVSIFDRYGKLLKQFNSNTEGWNGVFNNQALPASDYWFVLNLKNNKTIKGHFSLKR